MILKVQIPIHPPGGQALIYDQKQEWMGLIDQADLPTSVVRAARGGKAYFYAEMDGDEMIFGAQAPAQDW